jgi:hypothetical protein
MGVVDSMTATQETLAPEGITLEERIVRLDTLMCILFGGLVAHPLASSLVPPAELDRLRALLPKE